MDGAAVQADGVNYNNQVDPYGFHQGAAVLMADGSVHLLPPDVSQAVLTALLSREGGEIISGDDF